MALEPPPGLLSESEAGQSFEWEPFRSDAKTPSPDRPTPEAPSPHPRRAPRRSTVAALLVAAALALATAAFLAGDDPPDTQQADRTPPSTAPDAPGPSSSSNDLDFARQIPGPPADVVRGQVLVYASEDDELVIIDLASRERIETGRFTGAQLPQDAMEVRLLNSSDAAYVFDVNDMGRSGLLSGQLRVVRFDIERDRYSFLQRETDATGWSLGSLWGPVVLSEGEIAADRTVMVRAERGAVITGTDGVSAVLDADGVRALPTRLGRIVAASNDLLAGVYCDEFGRCEGRITDWNGDGERTMPAEELSLGTVTLSPDGRTLVASGAGEWIVRDLDSGETTRIESRLTPAQGATLSDDGTLLAWFVGSDVAIADLRPEEPATYVLKDLNVPSPDEGTDLIIVRPTGGDDG